MGWNGTQCETGIYVHEHYTALLHCDPQYGLYIAICMEGFCENGGDCLHPNTNCFCVGDWIGNRCTQSNSKPPGIPNTHDTFIL